MAERRRIQGVAVLLAIVVVAQLAAVVSRSRTSTEVDVVAVPAGTEHVVSDLLLAEGRVLRATVTRDSFRPPAHALYGETARDDPLDGRLLAVGSALSDGAPVVPTSETPGFRLVELGSRSVAVGADRAWTWATWKLPDCTGLPAAGAGVCQGYAAGRNLREGEVIDAARAATVGGDNPAAGAVPAGLTLLATARLDLRVFDAPGSQLVSWIWKGDPLALRFTPGVELALLMRFWVDGGPVEVRGRRGAVGEIAGVGFGGDLVARAWDEGGRSLVVLTSRLLFEEVDRFVAGLRPAGPGNWDALRARVLDVASGTLVRDCSSTGEPFTVLGRTEERFRWAVGLRTGRPNQFAFCGVVLTPERTSLASAGGPRPAPCALSVATMGAVEATDATGLFVVGVAPQGTALVRLDVAGGHKVDAELAGNGPAPGERYYAGFVEGSVRTRPTVVALDGAGAEIARAAGRAPA
ncbi:MAG: hypothetical protein ACR2HM_08730 [Acidimicrobiales bacterium]